MKFVAFTFAFMIGFGCRDQGDYHAHQSLAQDAEDMNAPADGAASTTVQNLAIEAVAEAKSSAPAADPTTSSSSARLDAIDVSVDCQQTAATNTPDAPTLTVLCTAKTANGENFDPRKNEVQIKWTFFHSFSNGTLKPEIQMQGDATSPSNRASFKFAGYFPLISFMADAGAYRLTLIDEDDLGISRLVPQKSLSVSGEGCGAKGSLSFRSPYFHVTGILNRIKGADSLGYIVDPGGRLTTDSIRNEYIIQDGGTVTDKGNMGLAFVMGKGKYTALQEVATVVADKAASISVPNKERVFYYRSPISLCN